MKETLESQNHLVVRNFIEKERAIQLATEFKQVVESQGESETDFCPGAKVFLNWIPFVELLVEKRNELCYLVGESLLPTYTMSRIYYGGIGLPRHLDRPSCEVSVTVNMWSDLVWPIYIETPDRQDVSAELQPGDAMVYKGSEAEHWRKPYQGDYCIQTFLHYVKTYGRQNSHFFDLA